MSAGSFTEHADVLLGIVGFLFMSHLGLLFWVLKKYSRIIDKHEEILPAMVKSLEKIDKNQQELYDRLQCFTDHLREAENRLSELKGSHDALVSGGNPHIRKVADTQ